MKVYIFNSYRSSTWFEEDETGSAPQSHSGTQDPS